jgi:uncharacterized protein YozE (UPF0346 family)
MTQVSSLWRTLQYNTINFSELPFSREGLEEQGAALAASLNVDDEIPSGSNSRDPRLHQEIITPPEPTEAPPNTFVPIFGPVNSSQAFGAGDNVDTGYTPHSDVPPLYYDELGLYNFTPVPFQDASQQLATYALQNATYPQQEYDYDLISEMRNFERQYLYQQAIPNESPSYYYPLDYPWGTDSDSEDEAPN